MFDSWEGEKQPRWKCKEAALVGAAGSLNDLRRLAHDGQSLGQSRGPLEGGAESLKLESQARWQSGGLSGRCGSAVAQSRDRALLKR